MKKVEDIMTRDVKSCALNGNLAEAVALMWENDCGVLPVLDNDGKVTGIITDRDISVAVGTRGKLASEISVGEVVSGEVFTCLPDDDVKEAIEIMRSAKIRRLPVVNNEKMLQGILSLNDIVLRAEEVKGKEVPDLSYKDVAITLKVVCEHRVPKVEPIEEMELGVSAAGD
ncbi:MAG: CBS domain-containing protein [Acidobacteriota bacterium]